MAWREIRDRLRAAAIDTPELDARLFAEAAFGMDRLELVTRERELARDDAVARLDAMARRRLAGEPVKRILGEAEFWSLGFSLNAATLVPRPDTELLVRRGLFELAATPVARILDLGTGSGAIPIALLSELPRAMAVAVDLSAEALEMARANAERHHVAERLDLREGSWFEPLDPGERFELVTANPPYIESAAIAGLDREVREHDPLLALDGGPDGLEAYRAIAAGAAFHMAPGGVLLLEIGSTQAVAVTDIFVSAGYGRIDTEQDLGGRDRLVAVRLR